MKNGKYCILIADDEKEIRDILRLLLEGEGYAVLTAEDGREAIAEAAAEVDLYILDVNMPEVSGFPAAAEIRKHFDAPIVFLTAYSTELDTESRSVSRQGEMIPLTYTEFQILELLVTHKKKIYSLENIYQSIWGEDAVGDSAIMVHIKNIRKKLGDDSRNPKYIKTAWGRGYYVDQ